MATLISKSSAEVEEEFHNLAEKWRQETGPLSSAVKMAMHPAYQRIIGMGPAVLPCVLRELQRRPDHWFWALRAITGEDMGGSAGDFESARKAWLDWGKRHGYLS